MLQVAKRNGGKRKGGKRKRDDFDSWREAEEDNAESFPKLEKDDIVEADESVEIPTPPLTPRAPGPSSQHILDTAEASPVPATHFGESATSHGTKSSDATCNNGPEPIMFSETPPSVRAVRRRILASRAEARARGGERAPLTDGAADDGHFVSLTTDAHTRSAPAVANTDTSTDANPAEVQTATQSARSDLTPLQLPNEGSASAESTVSEAVSVEILSTEHVTSPPVTVPDTDVTLDAAAESERIRGELEEGASRFRQRQEALTEVQERNEQRRMRDKHNRENVGKVLTGFANLVLFVSFLLVLVQIVKILEGSVWTELAPIYHSQYLSL